MTERNGSLVPTIPNPGFAWQRLAGGRVLHLNFGSYDKLEALAPAFISDIKANPPDVLIIDLRENHGGDFVAARLTLILPVWNLTALNRNGRLYVLIGRQTFSAAMTNATDFRRETEAVLVGEPTGARPNGYQELSVFALPNSKLRIGCATHRYRFGEPSQVAVQPDLLAAPNGRDFRAGHDPAIARAIAHSVSMGVLPSIKLLANE